jgi:hypothetical protein
MSRYKEHFITLGLVVVGVMIALVVYNKYLNSSTDLSVTVQ